VGKAVRTVLRSEGQLYGSAFHILGLEFGYLAITYSHEVHI
jgi:hypothetical protein